ncbi:MAG: type I DNA topoisomerase [Candidatus Paceibacterota bacterium]|jgi:DNA topoisomerase-1
MKLLIVESPAKAKTIEKYLDGEYTVKASVGHVRDLPKSNKQAIDIEAGFVPHYEISKGKEHVLEEIGALAKKASVVILATDPDREGEAIAWHIKEALKLKGAKRVTFNEITKDAVKAAIEHPRDIDENLRRAQEARRVLDRLVGYDLSGIIWKKVRYGLSAGRVQSPALRILMEREREIRAFIPEDYFVLSGDFESKENAKKKATLSCTEEPRDRAEAERIAKVAKEGSWSIVSIEKNEVKRSPRAPFITSTLQQTASSRFGYSPSRTMMLAQRLYEAGHITYMRTDSTTLSKVALTGIAKSVEGNYGKEYLEFHNFDKKSKNAQEAHEAIRPSHFETEVAGANDDEKKLYTLIWQRTVASQMKDAKLMRTKICANVADKSIPDFAVNGSTVVFDGWLKADPGASGEEVILPEFKENEALKLLDLHTEEKQTQPPSRYTEAGLVKELEKRGIGRPSTYASIIKTLEDREYVTKENKSLKPTDTGDVVSSFLENNFEQYISDGFTASMEERLDDIANGDAEYVPTLEHFYTPLHAEIKIKEKLDKATNMGLADERFKCPKCGSSMIIKLGRGGKFLSCSTYPDCDGALTFEGLEIKKDEPIGNDSATGLPIYVKTGKYGPYVQLGEMPAKPKKGEKKPRRKKGDPVPEKPAKPRMASIPKEFDPTKITMADAEKFLSLPRVLGVHPESGKNIVANRGRFGPYVMHDGDFRSLKKDDVFDISYERALEILKEPKKIGRGRFKKKEK